MKKKQSKDKYENNDNSIINDELNNNIDTIEQEQYKDLSNSLKKIKECEDYFKLQKKKMGKKKPKKEKIETKIFWF